MTENTAKPTVSVIIPVYNGAQYLGRAIQSVLSQTHPAHEIIIIDDGSFDATPSIMEKFKGRIIAKRIPNSGPAVARNVGIEMSTGDYVAFLDHDDVWFKTKLEKQVDAVIRYPEIGFVCTNFTVRYPHLRNRMVVHFSILKNSKSLNFNEPLKQNAFKLLIEEHFIGTSSAVMIKRDVIKKVGLFNPIYRSTQDYDYWVRCSLVTNFIVLSEILFYKKNHVMNISQNTVRTHTFRKDMLKEIIINHGNYIHQHHFEDICMQALADCYFFLGNLHFEAAQIFEAYRCYIRGLWTKPSPKNLGKFTWAFFKKTTRLLTFNLLSRKNFNK